MTKSATFFAAALWLGLCSQNALATCYVLYGADRQVVYRSVQPPVDMSLQLHQAVPTVVPGGTLVFSSGNVGCDFEVNELARYAQQAQPEPALRAPRAPRG